MSFQRLEWYSYLYLDPPSALTPRGSNYPARLSFSFAGRRVVRGPIAIVDPFKITATGSLIPL
jgi:hypothetical protein